MVLQYLKKESTESLEGEKNTEKFCATEQNKKCCRTIKSSTADKKRYIMQYLKKEGTEHLEGDNKELKKDAFLVPYFLFERYVVWKSLSWC